MGKWQKHKKTSHPREQEVNPFPAGDHKAARNRQDSITDIPETQITKRTPKRSTALERSVRTFLEGLNIFDSKPSFALLVEDFLLMTPFSVGRCVIPCAFFGKSVKHIFSCSKMYPYWEKRCLQFFLGVWTSLWRHKKTYQFLAYLRLKSGVLWIPAGIKMNCLISCGNFTGDMLISE